MTDVAAHSAPVAAGRRLDSLDLLRGFALCGILLVNIISMGGIWEAYVPDSAPSLNNPDWIAWLIQHVFLQGSMRGLFTLLFGAGMLLITLRGGGKGTIESADIYFRRCMVLLALGVINVTVLLFPGDILYVYGLSGFFLFAFRAARPRTLILTSVLLIALLTGVQGAGAYKRAMETREGRAVPRVICRPNGFSLRRGKPWTPIRRPWRRGIPQWRPRPSRRPNAPAVLSAC